MLSSCNIVLIIFLLFLYIEKSTQRPSIDDDNNNKIEEQKYETNDNNVEVDSFIDIQQKYYEIRKALLYMCSLNTKCSNKFFINNYILDEELFNFFFDRFIVENNLKLFLVCDFFHKQKKHNLILCI